jgi:hypothetical protein
VRDKGESAKGSNLDIIQTLMPAHHGDVHRELHSSCWLDIIFCGLTGLLRGYSRPRILRARLTLRFLGVSMCMRCPRFLVRALVPFMLRLFRAVIVPHPLWMGTLPACHGTLFLVWTGLSIPFSSIREKLILPYHTLCKLRSMSLFRQRE